VLFEGTRAIGAELKNGTRYGAAGEVILCAGAIETPRLMQLSGIGDADHLSDHGIDVVANLPGLARTFRII